MAVEIQENRVRRAPLIFTVPACGSVVAPRTRQFQLRQSTVSAKKRFAALPWSTFRNDNLPSAERREPTSNVT
jgi:hypothetical protein